MYMKQVLTGLFLCVCLGVSHAAVTVGACIPGQHSYPTITSAIAAAHQGDVINVCPGTYAEQLTITKGLTIQGVVIAHKPGVTITAPAAGLHALPAGSGSYPQVFVNNANGQVTLHNLAISGTGASVLVGSIVFDTTSACQIGFLQDFPGISFVKTHGTVDHVSVSGHFVTSATPDSGPGEFPDCGTGIEFNNRNEQAVVQESVVNGFGFVGILSTGKLDADHNVVGSSDSGPFQVGIEAGTGSSITGNAVTGGMTIGSIGIQSPGSINDNTVQSWSVGVVSTGKIRHNMLLNNMTGISGATDTEDNVISAAAQYPDPQCDINSCEPGEENKASIGIDLLCEDGSMVKNNEITGVGIGIAEVKKNEILSTTNLFANVTTTSTSCAQ